MQPPIWNELKAKNLSTRGYAITGVVLHDTAGSGTHNDTLYLAHPGDGRPVSVDFTAERDGSIWKLNPDLQKFCCSHAGRHTSFKGMRDGHVNHATVGIEIVQKADLSLMPLYPEAQVKAVATLCAWLTEEFRLEADAITTHRNIITDGSRSDPRRFPFEGPGGFWEYFWEVKGLGEHFKESERITKTPNESQGQRHYTVETGDSLYSIAAKTLGSGEYYARIAKANGIDLNKLLILPGQVLIIPEKEGA